MCLNFMDEMLNSCYFGTSGLLLPVPNKLHYPEEFKQRSRLSYYASLMNSIEINSSFYKIPKASTVKRWAVEVPEDFRFTFKVFRGLTHNKGLIFNLDVIERFMEAVSAVGEKRGCLLVQFPASIRIAQFRALEVLLSALRTRDADGLWNIAVEFRHSSLYVSECYELLKEFDMSMVIHDKSNVASPMVDTSSKFSYLRLHGPLGNYKGSYDDGMLYEYAGYVSEWLKENRKVFVYFNNTMGQANANLQSMRDFVNELT